MEEFSNSESSEISVLFVEGEKLVLYKYISAFCRIRIQSSADWNSREYHSCLGFLIGARTVTSEQTEQQKLRLKESAEGVRC